MLKKFGFYLIEDVPKVVDFIDLIQDKHTDEDVVTTDTGVHPNSPPGREEGQEVSCQDGKLWNLSVHYPFVVPGYGPTEGFLGLIFQCRWVVVPQTDPLYSLFDTREVRNYLYFTDFSPVDQDENRHTRWSSVT